MVAGLRSIAKAMELPPEPSVRAPALDPTREGLGVKFPGATRLTLIGNGSGWRWAPSPLLWARTRLQSYLLRMFQWQSKALALSSLPNRVLQDEVFAAPVAHYWRQQRPRRFLWRHRTPELAVLGKC